MSAIKNASAVNVTKLGYVEFETPDVDAMVSYYTEALDFVVEERTATTAYLTPGVDHHAVVIQKSEEAAARTSVGFQIDEDLADAEQRLRDAGYDVERRSDMSPGTPDALVMLEPATGAAIHLYDAQSVSGAGIPSQLRPTKLGHVAAFVPSLPAIQPFYENLLGFRWSDTIGDFFVFLRCNTDHHAANFMAAKDRRGMHHIAYEMRDLAHLQSMLDHLSKTGRQLYWGPGRHGPGHNIFTYHTDPDGNVIELFTQLDQMPDETLGFWQPQPWHTEFPSAPKTWEADAMAQNSWGPLNPRAIAR